MADEPSGIGTAADATSQAVASLPDDLFGDAPADYDGWPAPGEATGETAAAPSADAGVAPAGETPAAAAPAPDGAPPTDEPGTGDGAPSQGDGQGGTAPVAAPEGGAVAEAAPAPGGDPAAPELDAYAQALPEEARAQYLALPEEARTFHRQQIENADPYRAVRDQFSDMTQGQTPQESAQEYARLLAIKRAFVTNPRELARRLLAQRNLPPEAAHPGWEPGQPTSAVPGQPAAAEPSAAPADPLADVKALLESDDARTELGDKGHAISTALLQRIEAMQQESQQTQQALEGQRSMTEQHRQQQAETAWDEFSGRQTPEGSAQNPLIGNVDVQQRMQVLASAHPVIQAGGILDADALQELYNDAVGSLSTFRQQMIEQSTGQRQAAAPAAAAAPPAPPAPAAAAPPPAPRPVKPRAGAPPALPGPGAADDGGFTLENGMRVPGNLVGKTDELIGHLLDQFQGRTQ